MSCSASRRVRCLWGARAWMSPYHLRRLNELLGDLCGEVRCVVRLHPGGSAVPGKPLVKDNFGRGLRVVFVMGARNGFSELCEMVYYDQKSCVT